MLTLQLVWASECSEFHLLIPTGSNYLLSNDDNKGFHYFAWKFLDGSHNDENQSDKNTKVTCFPFKGQLVYIHDEFFIM
jgi:hypothetical protein